jgi:hypothetical protein
MAVINWENRRSGCYLGETNALNQVNAEIIIASGAGVLYPGTVLGKITASSKFVLHDAGLSNGAEVADAILFHKVDATSADVTTVATVRGPSTINGNDLIFKSGISNANKLAAKTALRTKGLRILPQHADDVA